MQGNPLCQVAQQQLNLGKWGWFQAAYGDNLMQSQMEWLGILYVMCYSD